MMKIKKIFGWNLKKLMGIILINFIVSKCTTKKLWNIIPREIDY